MSGKVRNLIPYFVPGQGDTVNESLSHYTTTPTKSSPPRVPINVRKWDHTEGYFKDTIHVIHDNPPQTPKSQPIPQTQTPRLLTPAEIRQARQKAIASSPNNQSNKSPRNINDLIPSPTKSSPPTTSSPSTTKPRVKTTSPPAKPRPFAGSTFETASPPPAGLPIPGFVKSRTNSQIHADTPHDREQAAVDLKRILRI